MGIMEEEEVSRSEALMVMVMVAIGHSGVPFRLNSVLSQSHACTPMHVSAEAIKRIRGLRP